MGSYRREIWQVRPDSGSRRDDRRGGAFLAYQPDSLTALGLVASPGLARRAAQAESAVRDVCSGARSRPLEGIARLLLRSEAIASSQIEGIAPSPQQVALAELAQVEDVRGFSDQAKLVANNISVLRGASQDLLDVEAVSVSDIVALHKALLPDERYQGLRRVQNWIGGSNWHPLDAEFVPPGAAQVPDLMEDLAAYINGSIHAPLVQAALVHAQFESIHPFVDGNGRVGRALIHTVLGRRGLTPRAVLPVSLVLSTLRERYVAALLRFRFDGRPGSEVGVAGIENWLDVFMDAASLAAEQAASIASEVIELEIDWAARLARYRGLAGLRETPRADSAAARIMQILTESPVMTTATAQRKLGISFPPARAALEELAEAGILHRKTVDRGSTGYIARDVLDLVTMAERRLASTRFDTAVAPPWRPVPAVPD